MSQLFDLEKLPALFGSAEPLGLAPLLKRGIEIYFRFVLLDVDLQRSATNSIERP